MKYKVNIDEESKKLRKAWKFTLLHQFHDVLPGSSIPEVFDDVYDFWELAKNIIDEIEDAAWEMIIKKQDATEVQGKAHILFNGTGHNIENGILEIPIKDEPPSHIEIDGLPKAVQLVKADEFDLDPIFAKRPKRLITTCSIPQHGFKIISFNSDTTPEIKSSLKIIQNDEECIIENNLYKIRVNKRSGNVESIIYKKNGKEILKKPGIEFKLFFDFTLSEQCWNMLPAYREMEIEQDDPIQVKITEKGPVRATIEIQREIFNEESEHEENGRSKLIQRLSLYDNAPGIEIEFLIDWHTCDATAKLDIHTTTSAEKIVSETPYGTIERKSRPEANHDVPRWENVHQTWFDIPSSDNTWGVAIINNGKYGHDAEGGRVGLTVIRGPLYPLPSNEAWIHQERQARMKNFGDHEPKHAELGTHLIKYFLVPHEYDSTHSKPFIPSLAHWYNEGYSLSPTVEKSLDGTIPVIKTSSNLGEITVLKKHEDSQAYVIRIVEVLNKGGNLDIIIPEEYCFKDAIEMNLLEQETKNQEIEPKKINGNLSRVSIKLKPHEIKTIALKFH